MSGPIAAVLVPPPVAELLVKATAIFAGAALLAVLMRRRSAAARHLVWLLSLSSAVALMLVSPAAPRLTFAVPAARFEGLVAAAERAVVGAGSTAAAPSPAAVLDPASALRGLRAAGPRPPHAGAWLDRRSLGLLWLGGAVAVLLWSLLGHLGLAHLRRRAIRVAAPERGALFGSGDVGGLGSSVTLGLSPAIGAPVTWGWRRPVILLPSDIASWPVARRRAALAHELAHIERRDYLAQLVAVVACALYWFHPLAWLAASRLRSEGEHACDDRVLARGTPAPEYAADLLEVARRARALRQAGFAAVHMARRSRLEGRLLAVLDAARPRGSVSARSGAVAAVLTGLLLIPFAGLVPRRVVAGTASHARHQDSARSSADAESGSSFERELDAKPGETLELDLSTGGAVRIRGWDHPRVRVEGRLEGRDRAGSRATVERTGHGVRVRCEQVHWGRSYSTSHQFEIQVPRRFDVRLSSAGGEVSISGVEGTFRGNTGGGELTLEDLRGTAELSTGGGDIEVADSRLDGHVSTGGGTVRFSRVEGDLRGASGSGPVIYTRGGEGGEDTKGDLGGVTVDPDGERVSVSSKRSGVLYLEKAGGDITLDEAPHGAEVSTGGGDVRIGRSSGRVAAATGGGNITIGPVAGSVEATTGAGEVRVTLADAGGKTQDVDIRSGSGRVTLDLPPALDARLELETAYTRSHGRPTSIKSPWPLEREAVSDWDDHQGTPRRYVRAHGVLGQGRGLIRVVTVNGDIEIRRGAS